MNAQATAPRIGPEFRVKARALRPAAVDYCAKRAFADGMRQDVDAIARRILAEECPLYKGLDEGGDRITEPKDYWLCEDQEDLKAYYAAQNRELRAAGLKPDEMGDEYCPALVAETAAIRARCAIIEALAPAVGIDRKQLYGKNEDKFFELAMGLILNA